MNNTILEKKKRVSDQILYALIQLSSFLSIFILLVIIGYILYRGIPAFDFSYLVNTTSIINDTVGILPNIINTLYIVIVTLLIACPIGIGGLFGMLFFGSVCHLGFSILTGSLTLAIMILPIISRNTQTALECVPKSYREAALGIGATKWYMIRTVLLPSAIPGILTGVILAMGRIVAESAALLFTAGSVAILPTNIFGHLLSSGGTLTIQLYLEMAKGNYEVSFVIALVLVVIVLGLNMLAKWISRRFDVNKGDN